MQIIQTPVASAENMVRNSRVKSAIFIIAATALLSAAESFRSSYPVLKELADYGEAVPSVSAYLMAATFFQAAAVVLTAAALFILSSKLFKGTLSFSQSLCILSLGQLCRGVFRSLYMALSLLAVPGVSILLSWGNLIDMIAVIWLYLLFSGLDKEKQFYSLVLYYLAHRGIDILMGYTLVKSLNLI